MGWGVGWRLRLSRGGVHKETRFWCRLLTSGTNPPVGTPSKPGGARLPEIIVSVVVQVRNPVRARDKPACPRSARGEAERKAVWDDRRRVYPWVEGRGGGGALPL